MTTAATVANYIISLLAHDRDLETVKLQKLLYFAQGWSFALRGKQLFSDDFEAWKHGPVIRSIYYQHAKAVRIPSDFKFDGNEYLDTDTGNLDESEKRLIRAVVKDYGSLNPFELVDLTHLPNSPWSEVHQEEGTPQTISKDRINSFFSKEKERVRRTGELIPL